MRKTIVLSILTALAAMIGCGSSSSGGDGSGTTAGGSTSCGSNTCAAGQYCAQAQTGTCQNGCTSDANCATGTKCQNIDAVLKTGTCSESAAMKNCAGFLTKCMACGGGSMCTMDVCNMFSTSCVNCIADANCTGSAQNALQTCGCTN